MKKSWQAPQLIVLARGKPEESVLLSCKMLVGVAPAALLGDT